MPKTAARVGYEVGDWVIFEYSVTSIKEVGEDGVVRGVSDGTVSTCGSLTVYPLTLKNKAAAASVEAVRERLDRHSLGHLLNWPDIHRLLCSYAASIYEAEGSGDTDAAGVAYGQLYNWRSEVIRKLDELSALRTAGDIKLLNYSRANY